jgi:hypothetical protein
MVSKFGWETRSHNMTVVPTRIATLALPMKHPCTTTLLIENGLHVKPLGATSLSISRPIRICTLQNFRSTQPAPTALQEHSVIPRVPLDLATAPNALQARLAPSQAKPPRPPPAPAPAPPALAAPPAPHRAPLAWAAPPLGPLAQLPTAPTWSGTVPPLPIWPGRAALVLMHVLTQLVHFGMGLLLS